MYTKETPESIQHLFNSIATSYDSANTWLSFGMHHLWNRALVSQITPGTPRVLDLCAGTGEISCALAKRCGHVTLLDFSQKMLDVAQEKAKKHHLNHLTFIQGDAMALPFSNASYDAVTVAYGLRNVQNPQLTLREVNRVLAPGGLFAILELTKPTLPPLRGLHTLYLKTLLPVIGRLVSTNKAAYTYLSSSIPAFLSPANLSLLLQEEGFEQIQVRPLMGGIATLILATKARV